MGSLLLAGSLTSCSNSSIEATKSAVNVTASPDKTAVASTTVVKVKAEEVLIQKGKPGEAVVQLTIDPGYHINANPPTYPYLRATALELPGDQDFTLGSITYPQPQTKKFAFAEQALAVYEGSATIKVQLKPNKAIKTGEQKVGARLQVQACDDQVCYAPGVIDFAIPVNVK